MMFLCLFIAHGVTADLGQSSYVADSDFSDTPSWSCSHNFNGTDPLVGCKWHADWMSWGKTNMKGVTDPSSTVGDYALQICYPQGSYMGKTGDARGGAEFFAMPFTPATTVLFEYKVYFSDNFKWALGGKLPGLHGGTGKCGSGRTYKECFSIRFAWTRHGYADLYVYNPMETSPWYCYNRDVRCNFEDGHIFALRSFMLTTGTWQTIAMEVKLNDIASKDGSIKVYHNGYMVYHIENMMFRNLENMHVDKIFFATFFGGGPGENHPIFASVDNVYTYFKDFKVFSKGEVLPLEPTTILVDGSTNGDEYYAY